MNISTRVFILSGVLIAAVRCSDDLINSVDNAISSLKIDEDTGNWTVGDCILAQFAVDITLHANQTDANRTLVLELPPRAVADKAQSNCQNETQTLSLTWSEPEKNSTLQLARNMTILFKRVNNTAYGVSRVFGVFELAHFKQEYEKNMTNITSTVDIDFDYAALEFKVPLGYSFLCSDVGDWQFTSRLHYSFPDFPPTGISLTNATVSAKKVKFDAFRPKSAPHNVYQVPMDCDYQPNDIVPVAVGVTLAAMVVLVLCSYLFCRRRARQSGYQSV